MINPLSIFSVNNYTVLFDEDSTKQGLLDFLYGLIDYQVLSTFNHNLPLNFIKKTVPYTLTNQFLANGIPTDKTLQKKLYDYVYYEITYPYFIRNFNDPFIPSDYNTRGVLENGAKDYAKNEAMLLFDYVGKSLGFIDSLATVIDLDVNKYVETVNNTPTIPRLRAIRENVTSGKVEANRSNPQMDMLGLVDDTKAYVDKASESEAIKYANLLGLMMDGKNYYVAKEWIWSGKKKTRHRGMDGVQVAVNDPFYVINERTGEACELMFPRDYGNDPTGANTANCGCDILYISDRSLLKWR